MLLRGNMNAWSPSSPDTHHHSWSLAVLPTFRAGPWVFGVMKGKVLIMNLRAQRSGDQGCNGMILVVGCQGPKVAL